MQLQHHCKKVGVPTEQTKFWRDPTLGDLEMLHATYVTHSFARHTHEGFAIGVIEAGIEEFAYQGSTHRAPERSIVIINPGEVHTGHAGSASGWTYRMFYPEVTLLQTAAAEVKKTLAIPYFPTPVIQDEQLAAQMHRLHIVMETSASLLERQSCLLWTLAQLVTRYADNRPLATSVGREDLSVQRAQEYLSCNYANSICLEQLAKIANLKPLRLLRVFQRQLGLPPHTYLIQVRVARAKEMLANGLPISQVAFDTGFTDQSHLNRHFKRLVGVTPGQYALGCCKNVQDKLI